MNQIDLKGRAAIVTGGAQGIGYAIAERLLRSGAAVALWDIDAMALKNAVEKLSALGKVAQAVADVTDEDSLRKALQATLIALGKVDILVNNAGISGPNLKTWEYPPADFRKVVEVDLVSVFLCCHIVTPHMLANKYGRIVNIASVAGKEGNPNAPAYSAAKAGVIGLTKSLGKETAGSGVIVNCITPAAARTAIFDQMTEEHIKFMLSKIPMNRFVGVDEIAALAAWLASEDCSFSTGATFDISGGRATY
jgi:NAD(P)-dependent dehydrogenase (short-subunit alcohol dehydrogenase family)